MQAPYSHTLSLVPDADDDDDDDICPVCDGKCTCANSHVAPSASASTSLALSQHVQPPVARPTLKIKLTLPPNLLSKRPVPSSSTLSARPDLKRKSHPKNHSRAVGSSRATSQQDTHPSRTRKNATLTSKPNKKAPLKKRRRIESSDGEDDKDENVDDLEDDAIAMPFPTFVEASVLPSSSDGDDDDDDNDLSSLSSFNSSSSMMAEEESFIRAEHLRKPPRESWIIKPRKQSVGPSDVDMDDDSESDGETDGQDGGDEEQEDDDEEEEDEQDSRRVGPGYIGIATGWSEDDEDTFDADLFFASLSDSEHNSSSESSYHGEDGGDDADADESASEAHGSGAYMGEFEVTQGWDGEIMFTDGPKYRRDALRLLDQIDLEAHPIVSTNVVLEQSSFETDVEETPELGSPSDGAEELTGECSDTTDEDLVGPDNLPNERAMQLFSLPPIQTRTPSAVNPSDTLAARSRRQTSAGDPTRVTLWPGDSDEEGRNVEEEEERRRRARSLSSSQHVGPRPGFFEFLVQQALDVHNNTPGVSSHFSVIDGSPARRDHPNLFGISSRGRSRRRLFGPAVGHTRSSTLDMSSLDTVTQASLPPPSRDTSVAASSTRSSSRSNIPSIQQLIETTMLPSPVISDMLPSPGTETGAGTQRDSPGPPTHLCMELNVDDVLDTSLMDDVDEVGPSEKDRSDGKHIRNLKRWDFISVGAFRLAGATRGPGASGVVSDASGYTSEWNSDANTVSGRSPRSVIKSSPLAVLWQNRDKHGSSSRSHAKQLPTPGFVPSDGERTPMPHASGPATPTVPATGAFSTPKPKKQLKQERRFQRKGLAAMTKPPKTKNRSPHEHTRPQHQRQHHPNSKSRASSATQRSNFFSSPTPSLN
ncbi:hypothetical protein FISHEDRAFT_60389 [Fistulina hepatica ATCC 64428]|uniref:Uncharacterized protein n=1 Tax=Fistulina hepatica ATCC 64428 TaxID=1128425 RepID=A0A0D7A6S5_9AGAR|nr:hypothetical protein FISHEDRAFT_60389 [Fistulina hepatica ATCC 64428]